MKENIIFRQRKSIVVVTILLLLLIFFYAKSRHLDIATLYQVETVTHELIAQTRIIKGDMGLLVYGRLSHYDTLNESKLVIVSLRSKLDHSLVDIEAMKPALQAVHQALDKQTDPLEMFKLKLSIYRNSIRYLPTVLHDAIERYPAKKDILSQINTHIYTLLTQPSEFDEPAFKTFLKGIHDVEIKPLIKHLNMILSSYSGTKQAMLDFTVSDVETSARALSEKYQQWSQQKEKKVGNYRLGLLLFSIILLMYIAFILWRLNQSNDALKKSHAFLHYLQKALDKHAIVTVSDSEGNITFVNDKFCEVSGYTQDEAIGANHRVLNSGEHPSAFFKDLWDRITQGHTWRGLIKNKTKDGGFYWVDTTITPFLDEEGKAWQYVAVRTDVTHQIEMEERLKESRERYRILSSMVPYAMGIVQHDKWMYINPAAGNLFEAGSARDILHQPMLNVIGEADKQHIAQAVKQACEQEQDIEKEEVNMLTLSGKSFDAEIQGAPLIWEGERAALLVMSDISERKKEASQAQEYQAQLEHTQRLESLGVLAGGIAHDFNNILTSIMGNTALATKHVGHDELLHKDLAKVSKASERAAELCEQMLMYSGGGTFEKKPVLLNDLLDDVTNMVKTTLRDQVQLKVVVAPNLAAVDADIRQVQQVILNLLTNAVEAIEGLGSITVELGLIAIDETCVFDLVNHQRLSQGSYVFFEVTDSGCGMDDATVNKVFEPFFTTKFTGRGLGMSAMLGIVNAHHGAISIQTRLGEGTAIRVFFPISSEPVPEVKKVAHPFVEVKANSLILLIDDEPDILEFAQAVLTDVGFKVVTAVDGEDGIEKFEVYNTSLSAVVCDMVMPKLGGIEVAKYIHGKNPHLPILMSSGYDKESLTGEGEGMIQGFIHKPYMPDVLVEEVCRATGNGCCA